MPGHGHTDFRSTVSEFAGWLFWCVLGGALVGLWSAVTWLGRRAQQVWGDVTRPLADPDDRAYRWWAGGLLALLVAWLLVLVVGW